ncbi:MAG: hypothetical protein KAS78_03390 [Candidatus Pacebacteria bacterium]|nr:hypothetical protein [Candidatus Paceibacterota bacterium]
MIYCFIIFAILSIAILKIKPKWIMEKNDAIGIFIIFFLIAIVSFVIATLLTNLLEFLMLIESLAIAILSNNGIQIILVLLLLSVIATTISRKMKQTR